MNTVVTRRQETTLPLRYIAGIGAALAIALIVFFIMMNPPIQELRLMAFYLAITAVISIAAGYGAYRLGWLQQAPRVSWALLGGYALSSLLTFLNVWFSAQLMFLNEHDLLLTAVLLIFASGIALSLGYFISTALTTRIATLNDAAQAIARGELQVRVPVAGRDEVSELARTFNEMAAQLEEAERKQRKLEQLRRDLVTWIGHDLRTPLASIRAIVEALADGVVEDPDSVERYLRTAQRDIQALSLLIDDLFEMAQLDAGGLQLDRQPNAISDLVSDTLESFSAVADHKGVTLAGHADAGVDPVNIDAQKIERVLANLVSNAIRHTPAGGTVEVRAVPAENSVRVAVSDTGEGIPSGDLPRIFEQFYRGEKSRSRETGGAGLGLTIAKRIIDAHDGEIEIDSAVGAGTTVTFILPRR